MKTPKEVSVSEPFHKIMWVINKKPPIIQGKEIWDILEDAQQEAREVVFNEILCREDELIDAPLEVCCESCYRSAIKHRIDSLTPKEDNTNGEDK